MSLLNDDGDGVTAVPREMIRTVPNMTEDKISKREGWLRRTARKQGYGVSKDRRSGLWMLWDADTTRVEAEGTLEHMEAALKDKS